MKSIMKQSYQFSGVPYKTFCSLLQKFSHCMWETCLIQQPPPEEKTVGFKLPSRHHPQPALLSNQTNRNMGCSSFKSKEWVGKFTVTKIQAHSNGHIRTAPHSARYVSKYFLNKGFCKACCERSSVWM